MKKIIMSAAATLFVAGMVSCSGGASFSSVKTPTDSAAYALGTAFGQNMTSGLSTFPGDSLDVKLLLAGISDALNNKSRMTMEEAQAFIQSYVEKTQAAIGEANKKEGEEFLAKNATEEGVVVTESGLQYKYEVMGEGPKATSPVDTVVVHYKGSTLDGKVFDSSYDRGEPATFPLDRVIPGWTEAFQIFPAGSKVTIWIPSNLAYGEHASPEIGPNRMLRFDCELLEVRPVVASK